MGLAPAVSRLVLASRAIQRWARPIGPTPDRLHQLSRRTAWLLLLITIFGGWLRFRNIEHPPLWGDEAMTYGRVNGTYCDLLNKLRSDGFTPYHYQLLWWIRAGCPLAMRQATTAELPVTGARPPETMSVWNMPVQLMPPTHHPERLLFAEVPVLTPYQMRFLPAIAGTLMIPAMYFLARQLAGRRASLVAALLTCVSAYMMAYSRDAKMYMHTWLFITLHMGFLFLWLRTRTRLAWLGWIACGLAMAGFHASSLLVLPVELVIVLVALRPSVRVLLLWLMGVAIVGAGPAAYYMGFNRWLSRTGGLVPGVVKEGITDTTTDPRGPDWENSGLAWIETRNAGRSGPDLVLDSFSAYLAGWEWPTSSERVSDDTTARIPRWMLQASESIVMRTLFFAALGLLPWTLRWRGWAALDPAPWPWHTRAMWLAVWLFLPAYGFFYARSVDDFSPILRLSRFLGGGGGQPDWGDVVASAMAGRWLLLVFSAVAVAALCLWRPCRIVLSWLPVAIVAWLLLATAWRDPAPLHHAYSLGGRWLDALTSTPSLVLLGAIVPGLAWHYAGRTFAARGRRFLLLLGVVVAVLAMGVLLHTVWAGMQDVARQRNRASWASIWMPRYLAIVWPGLFVVIAILLMRLPTMALRWGAVAILVLVNFGNSWARIHMDTEPPVDRVVRDMALWRDSRSTTRVYVRDAPGGPNPSQGWVRQNQSRYYLCQELRHRPRPDEFFLFGEAFRRLPAGQGTELTTVISDARASAWVDRLIVWDYSEDTLPRAPAPGGMATGSSWVLDAVSGREGTAPSWFTPIACWVLGVDQPESAPPALPAAGSDTVMSRLGSRWRLVSDESYEIRVHWNWSLRGSCRRREYVRAPLESPASQPATTSRPRP